MDCYLVAGDACPHNNVHPETNAGAVAGIVIGVLCAVAAAIGGGIFGFRYYKFHIIARRDWAGGLAELGAHESDYAQLNTGGVFESSSYVPPGGGQKAITSNGEWQQYEAVPLQ